jgi:hypothetical protein
MNGNRAGLTRGCASLPGHQRAVESFSQGWARPPVRGKEPPASWPVTQRDVVDTASLTTLKEPGPTDLMVSAGILSTG